MHSLNLGVYLIMCAEGLLVLGEDWCARNLPEDNIANNLDKGLRMIWVKFKSWLRCNRISCSIRAWTAAALHYQSGDFPWMKLKAYNARVVLGWLAVARLRWH